MRAGCRVLATIAVAVGGSAGASATAIAHDSLAPRGAAHQWLPVEAWVFRHWIPFDERSLSKALGLRGRELEAYLYNDHHTLADLARVRAISIQRLADELVAPWGSSVDPERTDVLRDRTLRILTQGHLAQHVFFHSFHTTGLEHETLRVFGVTHADFRVQRRRGETPLGIARQHGIAEQSVVDGVEAILRRNHADGISRLEAWPTESDRILQRQVAALPCWLRRARPEADPGNPFGKATVQHGVHPVSWPSTAKQRSAGERGVERVRRSLAPSCWRRPLAWRSSKWHTRSARPARDDGPVTAGLHCRLLRAPYG